MIKDQIVHKYINMEINIPGNSENRQLFMWYVKWYQFCHLRT